MWQRIVAALRGPREQGALAAETRSLEVLARKVRSGSRDDRDKAFKAFKILVEMQSDDATRALLGALDGTIDSRWIGEYWILVGMLAELGTAGIGAMVEFLEREETDRLLQSAIAEAMAVIASPRPDAIRALARAVDRGSESAAKALGQVGPAASVAIPALMRGLACPGKGRFGLPAAAEYALKRVGPDVIPHVRALLSDP